MSNAISLQALKDEVGAIVPDVESLKNCKVSNLKSVCTKCNLLVFKTGGIKRPVSVKQDYINAITLYTAYLLISSTGAGWNEMLVDEPGCHIPHLPIQGIEEEAANCHVKIRFFKNARDFRTTYKAEILHAYHSEKGIKLRDLARELSLEGLCDVIHPKTYKPLLISTDGTLDPHLIPMLLGTQGFLRVTAVL
ncbi:hypothetical protein GALMADRAFT_145981 [Galerina marginata CBS 339.88]|uniref:Uncharacterized protein n=1 Tax=Galerina marginata (strain CBS 339.88) TaxID=685588 RepID=A0A067SDL7_GALM3|nr:hypothetical protein GALMADRAFT_145981 [Galerina marginata CBS 339.88]